MFRSWCLSIGCVCLSVYKMYKDQSLFFLKPFVCYVYTAQVQNETGFLGSVPSGDAGQCTQLFRGRNAPPTRAWSWPIWWVELAMLKNVMMEYMSSAVISECCAPYLVYQCSLLCWTRTRATVFVAIFIFTICEVVGLGRVLWPWVADTRTPVYFYQHIILHLLEALMRHNRISNKTFLTCFCEFTYVL